MAAAQSDNNANVKIGFGSLFVQSQFQPEKPYLTQLSPKAVPFVQEYIRRQGKELEKMKYWGRPYFGLYDAILMRYEVPKELKYLSVIESHLQSSLRSWAGAVGPWQLMDYEAKRFGLVIAPGIDERTNYVKSTEAAAKLLHELYQEFGDWLLVVAAYNGGAGRIRQAIRKAKSRDFWDLQYYLKEETRMHVKKFIGTHYIFEGGGGLTTMTKDEVHLFRKQHLQANANSLTAADLQLTDTLSIKGRYMGQVVAAHVQLPIAEFERLNPAFDQTLAKGLVYTIRLPKPQLTMFAANKESLLVKSIQTLLNPR